jgi:hypothetical protein
VMGECVLIMAGFFPNPCTGRKLVGKGRKEEPLASFYGVLEDMGVDSLTSADRQNYSCCDDRLCREK